MPSESQRASLTQAAEHYAQNVDRAAGYLQGRELWAEWVVDTSRQAGDVERFLARVLWRDPCFVLDGSGDKNGYAKFSWGGHQHRAGHFVLPERPSSQHIMLHSCDNPPCVTPWHLRWGTRKENTRDMLSRGRARGGRPRVLSAQQQEEVRLLHARGTSVAALGRRFGVSWGPIKRIIADGGDVNA